MLKELELADEMNSIPIEQQEELYRKTNPDYFVNVRLTEGTVKGRTVTFSCKKCGDVITKSSPDKDYTVPECEGCVKKVKNQNFRSLCQQNLVGRIYNGMEIIAQYTDPIKGYLCDIKCAICGTQDSIKTGVSIIDVVDGKYFHDCEYFKLDYICPNCETVCKVSIKQIKDSKDILCQKCGNVLDKSDLQFELSAYDRRLNLNSARKRAYGTTTALPEMKQSVNSDIYCEEVPIYRSLHDYYYRCICVRHVTKLVLSETELINYNCEKCHDIKEGIFKTLKPHNVLRSINNPKEASAWKWNSELCKFVRCYDEESDGCQK